MNTLPIIIEVCGIPYSRKTTTIAKFGKLLRQKNKKFEIIDEFRGERYFYEKAKYTPDLNIVRANRCLETIVTNIHNSNCNIILIDRGLFDTYCWVSWFHSKKRIFEDLVNLSYALLKSIKNYSSKYYIAWFDIDPTLSIAHHSHQGSIVNLGTMTELRSKYRHEKEQLGSEYSISRIEIGEVNSSILAEKLFSKFKL